MKSLYRIMLVVLLGMFILGQFGRIELSLGRALYFQDILLSIFLLLVFSRSPFSILQKMLHTKGIQLLLLFDGWVAFTSFIYFHNNISQLLTSALYLIRFNVILFFGYTVVVLIRQHVITKKQVQFGIFAAVTGIAVLGLIQYFFIPDTRGLQLLGWDDHLYRLISTIFDPGFTGVILAIGAVLCIERITSTIHKKVQMPEVGLFILFFVSLLLTYSRASYLSFCAGILYLTWKRKKVYLLGILALFAVGIVVLPRPEGEGVKLLRTASVHARVESVETAISGRSIQQLFFGQGWYVKKLQVPTQSLRGVIVPNHSSAPENSYVFVISSLGIVGFLLWSMCIFWTLRSLQWATSIVASLLVAGIHAFFSNTLFHPFVLLLLVTIMAGSAQESLELSQPKRRSQLSQ